ncbi:ROK family protein [Calderihabitans maritimus]|nr:ROK family protein [Calderihabitans maritimus]
MAGQKRWFLGIDIGGTNIKAGVVDTQGKVVRQAKIPTGREEGMEAVLKRVARLAGRLIEECGLEMEEVGGAGIGVPGIVNLERSMVLNAPNLGWYRQPLRERLKEHLGLPVLIDNDANLAAVGEYWVGAGNGESNFLMVTIGTGIGSGLILNGELYRGSTGAGAELGHMILDREGYLCGCGNRGCLETLTSATAIVRRMKEAIEAGGDSILGHKKDFHARDVFDAALRGDKLSRQVVAEMADYLAIALANVVNLLDIPLIVVGGGVAQAGGILFERLRRGVKERILVPEDRPVRIIPARLGNAAGLIGAAKLAMDLGLRGEV